MVRVSGTFLRGPNNVKHLYYSFNSITKKIPKGLRQGLECNQSLTLLDLSGNRLGKGVEKVVKALYHHPCLKVLNLNTNNISPDSATLIAREMIIPCLPASLTELYMASNFLDVNAMCEVLKARVCNENLEILDIRHNAKGVEAGRVVTTMEVIMGYPGPTVLASIIVAYLPDDHFVEFKSRTR